MKRLIRRLIAPAMASTLVLAAMGPATALTITPGSYRGDHGEFVYSCSYQLTTPSLDPNTVDVALSATATVTPHQTTNPAFATGVNCELSNGTGGAGLTLVGGTSSAVGSASFKISEGLPDVCFTASAVYLNGQSDAAPQRCVPIDDTAILEIKDVIPTVRFPMPPPADIDRLTDADRAEYIYQTYCVEWSFSQDQWEDVCRIVDAILHPFL